MPKAPKFERLKRVTDLFVTGTELVLQEDPPVLLWVRKPNPFDRTEAQRDGAFGQSRLMLRLDDGSEEIQGVRADAETRDLDALIDSCASQKEHEFYFRGRQDVEADEEWADLLPLIQRGALLDDSVVEEDEKRRIAEAHIKFVDAVTAAARERRKEYEDELREQGREEVVQAYIETYRQHRANAAFANEYRITELYTAIRDCDASTRDANGRWDHSACTHLRLFDSRQQFREEAPEDLLDRATEKLQEIMSTPAEAGNSGAPSTSSESSEQPRPEEESPASTPTET